MILEVHSHGPSPPWDVVVVVSSHKEATARHRWPPVRGLVIIVPVDLSNIPINYHRIPPNVPRQPLGFDFYRSYSHCYNFHDYDESHDCHDGAETSWRRGSIDEIDDATVTVYPDICSVGYPADNCLNQTKNKTQHNTTEHWYFCVRPSNVKKRYKTIQTTPFFAVSPQRATILQRKSRKLFYIFSTTYVKILESVVVRHSYRHHHRRHGNLLFRLPDHRRRHDCSNGYCFVDVAIVDANNTIEFHQNPWLSAAAVIVTVVVSVVVVVAVVVVVVSFQMDQLPTNTKGAVSSLE